MAKKEKDIKEMEGLSEEQKAAQENQQQKEQAEERSETEVLAEDLAREKDKFLRLFAEFENYKRRTSKERIELFKTAGQDIMVAMLPVLDDFDRAVAELSKNSDQEVLKGVELIHNKFRDILQNKGLAKIEVNQGDAFDAELHEAVTQIPAPTDDLKGKIIDVVENGYKLGDRVIRHPKVVVGQA
ncbi:nucleotide exchange factor GrpE [Robertkochia flava]|uniref:nucleotide exchange factor GrpE n=1 Tax=Robertkochia flava TaxID=3447986 RepID=UPI001CCB6C89|nr:nucleotide exchange factor GrpE [Robertkochia marina]